MPELPEVETIKNQLAERIIGKKILKVEVRLPKIFEGDPRVVEGATITNVQRRAKILLIQLSNNSAIVVHLKMTGQLVYGQSSQEIEESGRKIVAETVSFSQGIPLAGFELPGKTTHVILDLSDGGKLFFNDNRQFGWMKIMDEKQVSKLHEKHGPEPFDFAQGRPTDFTPEYLKSLCEKWGRPIKLLLMDQEKIAGIGNIYSNEALWCAQISPMKRARDLAREDPAKVEKLYECIRDVLQMGIKHQGSSAKDETYVSALGEKGKAQEHFVVYQKQGSMCPRCGGEIKMSRLGGRGTFFCPKCQK